jgi:hypothetical protein
MYLSPTHDKTSDARASRQTRRTQSDYGSTLLTQDSYSPCEVMMVVKHGFTGPARLSQNARRPDDGKLEKPRKPDEITE